MAYNNVVFKFLVKISSVALCALTVASCTTVDDELGLEFVPDSQKMKKCQADFSGIECFLTLDTLPSSNLGVAFFGVTGSPVFGITQASAVLQFLPGGFKDKEKGFGYLPVADTLKLYLDRQTFTGSRVGDRLGQRFYIYEVAENNIMMDSTYNNTYDVAKTLEGKPLFEFRYTDTTSIYQILKPIDEKGAKFIESLVTTDKSVYASDTAFHRKYKGLYIVSVPSADKNQQIFSAGLENSHLLLIAHNHDKDKVEGGTPSENGSDNKDTVSMAYYFDDGQYSTNTSINKFQHTYSGAIKSGLENPTTAVTTAYVQSLAGVSTKLTFTTKFIDGLKSAKINNDTTYRDMLINSAEIRLYLDQVTIPLLNSAPKRLGMYYEYKKFTPIPDYAYKYEGQGSKLDYGGYLDRTNGCYVMDIRNYVQKLMTDPTTQKTITLSPDVSMTYVFGEVALKSPAETDPAKIEVLIKYTLIK